MMYEAYEKKVRRYVRLAQIFKICVMCAIVALILGVILTLGYLSLRGIYFGTFTLEEQTVAFGDKPEFDCFVLLGTYRCEYASLGSENWSREQPSAPGVYRVRAVITKGFFGKKVYSEPFELTLYRRDIVLSPTTKFGASVPYGDAPVFDKHWEVKASSLAQGHYVDKASLAAYYFDGNGGITAQIRTESVVIRDRNGNDVTQGYNISAGQGTIKVKVKQITVVVANELSRDNPVTITKVYDGKDAATSNYFITSGELLSGDEIHITPTSALTEAGKHSNKVNYRIYNSAGVDRTSYYKVKLEVCRVEIKKRELTVSTPDVTLEYSGRVQYTDRYHIESGSLVSGHTVELQYTKDTGVQDVTKKAVENKVSLKIYSGSRDVTKNYDITYQYGSLTVKPRTLRVRTQDSQGLTYNGEAQSWTNYDIVSGSLGYDHRLSAKNAATLVEPGSCENRVEYKVVTSDGKDVTKNYNLTVEYGTLRVGTKGAALNIALKPLSKVYDSKPLDPDDYAANDLCSVIGGTLLGKDYIEIVQTAGSQTSAGSSNYSVQYRIMHKTADGKVMDATEWYDCSVASQGTLTVEKRKLTIRFDPITKQYDGVAAVPGQPEVEDSALPSMEGVGHKVQFSSNVIPQLEYSKNGMPVASASEIGTYYYTIPEQLISVVRDDASQADRTDNYYFVYAGNSIKIDGISLKLTAPSATKQYDGTPLSAASLSYSDVLVEWGASGYRISYTLTGAQTDAGVCNVGFADVVVTDASGKDVTRNFNISTVSGRLTVTPISIKVRSSSGSKMYDGKPMDNATQMTLLSGKLITGHVLGGAVNQDYVTDVGTHENSRVTPKVYNSVGQDVSRNYAITLEPGRYTVTVAPLHIGTPLVTGEYTGKPFSGTCDATAYAQGLASGQRVELDVQSQGSTLGMHGMQITGYRIRNSRGADVSANYDITFTNGTIEIVPRRISINTSSVSVPYTSAPAADTKIKVGGSGLLEGHSVRATFTYPDGIYEIGSVQNSLESVSIVDQSGKDVSEYYDITYNYGMLSVRPIAITVKTGSATKEVYDGQPIAAPSVTVTKGELLEGHVLRWTNKYENGVADVGFWDNVLTRVWVIDENTGADVSYMYNVSVDAGVLYIKQPFTVQMASHSAEKVYDGTPLWQDAYEQKSELIPGHTVAGVNKIELTEAGEVENRLTLIIHDEDGNDVSRNYKFEYQEGMCGTLIVTPRPLSILIQDLELTYNGTTVLYASQNQLTHQGLVDGERISLGVNIQTPGIGLKDQAEYLAPAIYNAGGRNVTDCYDITVNAEHMSVTVIPASLSLYLPDRYSKEYDGSGVDAEQAGYRATGLAAGHTVQYSATTTPAEPGIYTLEFTEYAVYDKNGEDVTENYTVQTYSCEVNIYKKYIKLTSESASRHYNGQPLTCHELKKYTLSGGYTLDVVFTGEQTEVGSSQNTFEVTVYDAQGNDVTEYCNINKTYGTLQIWDQIELTLQSGSAIKIFDGNALICHEMSSYKLPEGYTMEVVFTAEQTQPGVSDNTFEVLIYSADGEEVTDNFVITKLYGTLEVLASAQDWVLTLYSKSGSKTYDGQPLTMHALEPYELPEGFVLDVVFTGEQTEVGSSQNTFTARAYNRAGQELTVICEFGTLEVYLDVTVNAYEMTYTYDGTEKNCEDVWVQGLPQGYSVDVTFGAGLTVTGTKNVEITDVRVLDAQGTDITHLCQVKINTAKLTVMPRKLTVYVYGQSADSIAPVQGSLVEGHTMFAEYGQDGECYIEITDQTGTLVYSNRGDSPIRYVLYDVTIQRG